MAFEHIRMSMSHTMYMCKTYGYIDAGEKTFIAPISEAARKVNIFSCTL